MVPKVGDESLGHCIVGDFVGRHQGAVGTGSFEDGNTGEVGGAVGCGGIVEEWDGMNHVGIIMVHDKIVELIVGVQSGASGIGIIGFGWDIDLDTDGVVRMLGSVSRNRRRLYCRMC